MCAVSSSREYALGRALGGTKLDCQRGQIFSDFHMGFESVSADRFHGNPGKGANGVLVPVLTHDSSAKMGYHGARTIFREDGSALLRPVENVWAVCPDAQNHVGRVEEIRKCALFHPK